MIRVSCTQCRLRAEIANQIELTHTIMEHWVALFPGRILKVRYEELVEDQVAISRQLLAHCKLSWDAKVLDFHETVRNVHTASLSQASSSDQTRLSSLAIFHQPSPFIQAAKLACAENGKLCDSQYCLSDKRPSISTVGHLRNESVCVLRIAVLDGTMMVDFDI